MNIQSGGRLKQSKTLFLVFFFFFWSVISECLFKKNERNIFRGFLGIFNKEL